MQSVARGTANEPRTLQATRKPDSVACSDPSGPSPDTVSSTDLFEGFVDPDMGDPSDPLGGMGALTVANYAALPAGSTQTGSNTYQDPNGNTWICNGGNCLMVIGNTGTGWVTPAPVIVISSPDAVNAPNQMAAIKPQPGQLCPSSGGGGLALGANLPLNQDTNIVINIYYVYEPTTFVNNPGVPFATQLGSGTTVVGLIYVTNGGQYFFQGNGADGNFIANLVGTLPGGSAIAATQNNAITPPLTPAQANAFFKSFPMHGLGKGSGKCFTTALPASAWA
jgi:hypothetical protein